MREAAATALEMAAGHDRTDLSTNTMLVMALTRCLEILGEVSRHSFSENRFDAQPPYSRIFRSQSRHRADDGKR
jgi:uncharacterized protein with HEPN domain